MPAMNPSDSFETNSDGSSTIAVPSIPDVVYSVLRRDIARGLYPPGKVSIRQLAAGFGVSPMPVREALRRLQAEGLITFNGGRQVAIKELMLEDLVELFAIRAELEPLALRNAAPRLLADSPQLSTLDRLIDAMEQSAADYDHWRDLNREFHQALYAGAEMPRLESIIDSVIVAVEPYARLYGSSPTGLELAQAQHRAIVDLVRTGDVDAASVVLREHLENALDVLRRASDEGSLATRNGSKESKSPTTVSES